MSSGAGVPWAQGMEVARELVGLLGPACERLEVAGSLRRRVPEVGDVELVAVPRVSVEDFPVGIGLMTEEVRENRLTTAVDALLRDGTLVPHPTDPKRGDRYSKVVHAASGLQLDLFSVLPPATWGVIFTIRTGPADYSQRLVSLARRRVLHVVDGALHRGSMKCGAIPCEVVPTEAEAQFYAALGVPHLPPEHRR